MSLDSHLQYVAKFSKFGAAGDISLFTFRWDGIDVNGWQDFFNPFFNLSAARSQAGTAFNSYFVNRFPRIINTTPFTVFTQPITGVAGARLTGTAETTSDENEIRNSILAFAQDAGLDGNPSNLLISSKTIQQLQQGDNLSQSVIDQNNSNITKIFTTDGANELLDAVNPLSAKNIDTTTLLLIGGAIILLNRK